MKVQEEKYLEAIENPNIDYLYRFNQENFNKVPGSPVAYWISNNLLEVFNKSKPLINYANCATGMQTGDNSKYMRNWYEVKYNEFNSTSEKNSQKWQKYNGGGNSRKWYGNHTYVIYWKDDGQDVKKEKKSVIRNERFYFREGISWKRIGSSDFFLRYLPPGFIIDQSGDTMYMKDDKWLYYLLAYVNTKVALESFKFIAPTLNLTAGNMNKLPILLDKNYKETIEKLVKDNIEASMFDWDSFEISWDFKEHPFLQYKEKDLIVEESYNKWEEVSEKQFYQLKENEEELNRIFIDIYGLQDELTPDVDEKDVTVRKANKERDVKSFLSYLVGVLFGRYSLDEAGLVYAGGKWNASKYKTFHPVEDNIIPMTEDGYFEQDIVSKIESLLTIIYGEESLEENLHFIADALNKRKNETDRDSIRRYFMKEFFKDHSRIYQKRPIYWEFSSGRRGAFKGLMYLHRYDRDTIARLRTDYVLTESRTLDNLIMLEEHIVEDENSSTPQKVRAEKAIENYQKDKKEVAEYTELLDHVARGRIELDLDDGLKVNYEKFQKIEIVDNQTGKVKKQDVLSKI